MQPFTEHVIRIVRTIPEGRVMTYGQVAALAGSPRAARQVVRILHSMSQKHQLPWYRVVNAAGHVAIKDQEGREMQKILLEEEGVAFYLNSSIDLNLYQFHPEYTKNGLLST
ncbi:MAG: MGMT family protein [Gorillibacterium sp.]|nr:MGMT family protein [Gorillibacterium sp.]